MAITSLAQLNAALPGQWLRFSKVVTGTGTTPEQGWNSSWTFAGAPGTGVAPASGMAGDIPTDATAGGFPFTNPAAGNSYLARMVVREQSTVVPSDMIAIYDRLWHQSGINVTSTGAQTIQTAPPVAVPLTRPDANGDMVEAWWEVYVVMGAGTPTVTLTYTDSAGNTGQSGTSGAFVTTTAVGRTGQFSLAAGDTGVRSIQTWQANATFTSGTIGLVQRRCLTMVKVDPDRTNIFDGIALALPRVYNDACLEVLYKSFSNQTITSQVTMQLTQG